MYCRTSHHLRPVVAYGSWVAWHLYVGPSPLASDICVCAETSASEHTLPFPLLSSTRLAEPVCSDESEPTGFSHCVFQNSRHPAWHPPWACPSHRVSKWTVWSTRRERIGKTVSQVLWARLETGNLCPQNANISGMNGIPSISPVMS